MNQDSRELKRAAKRRQKALSSLPHDHGAGGRDGNLLSVLCNGGWVGGCGEMGGGGGGVSGSDGEEEQLRPPFTITTTTISISSRKREKLHGRKVPASVDPALVPRKLRSAINKRSSKSASPPLPDAKKKHNLASSQSTQSELNGTKRSKQNEMHDPLTQDEEEVADTLFALATMSPLSKPVEMTIDGRSSEEKSETNMFTSSSSSEAALKENPDQLPLLTKEEVTNISSDMERPIESVKVESMVGPTVLELSTSIPGSKELILELNGTGQENLQSGSPWLKNGCVVDLTKTMNFPNPMVTLLEAHSDGVLRPKQPEVIPLQNPEIGLTPVTSAATEMEVQPMNKMLEHNFRLACPEEATLGVQPDLPTTSVHLMGSPSAEAAVCPDSVNCSARPRSTRNNLPMAKLRLVSADRRRSWKNCGTHVYISHITQNYQKTEKRHQCLLPDIQSKHKEEPRLGVVAADKLIGFKSSKDASSPGVNGFSLDGNQHEARIEVEHDRRHQPDQQASTSSRVYSHQTLNYNFLSLSAGRPSTTPVNGLEYSMQLPVAHLHPLMPFSLPSGHHSFPYPDQPAAAQQFQLPHYVGNPFYRLHMGHVGVSAKQQQQMWQSHLSSHYSSSPSIMKWPNGRPLSPFSLVPCTQAPSQVLRGVHPPTHDHLSDNLQQYQPAQIPPSPFLRATKNHQHDHFDQNGGYEGRGGAFRPEGASQFHQLCNAQHM